MSSKCKHCGEALAITGNYTFRIIPAKRIPKKARKLIKKGKIENPDLLTSSSIFSDTTSFQKFLLKRTNQTNFMELTCGKCGAVSKTKMQKDNQRKKVNELDTVPTSTPDSGTGISRKKRKRTKDKTAGLTIPKTQLELRNEAQSQNSLSIPVNPAGPSKSSVKVERKTTFQKQKEMDNLKKALFESKKAKKSGSSLLDFISNI